MTRAEALREYKSCLQGIAESQAAYDRVFSTQHGWIGRSAALEDYMSDAEVYSKRVSELAAFLTQEEA